MYSHLTTLGFPVTTEQDFRHYAYEASEFGEKIETPRGSYTLWKPGSGIELWVQTNLHKRIIGMRLHFSGSTSMHVYLAKYINRPEQSILDGALSTWISPGVHNANYGGSKHAIIFDLPDYDAHIDLKLPSYANVQLAAFAREFEIYPTEEIWEKCRRNLLATETMIPGNAHWPGLEKDPLQSAVFVNARILESSQLTNPITGLKFHWARVRTLGGEMDVVADPQLMRTAFVPGGIITGLFWLSGKILS